ncbi:MAG: PIN domain-containing protein [Alphaproteobacteria bacterium]|nr:PIN domain-containing protein [Alphaproteobacteria bacterium]MBN9570564.1 PIN domain-containing protein [Alphaproteobacteria bacterium]
MILVDTSVWIDHLRKGDAQLTRWLTDGLVLVHPFIVGEIALGSLRQRKLILESLQDLPQAVVASDAELLRAIEDWNLAGSGIGYVDAHLLASARLSDATRLWTRDRKLNGVAARLGLAL